MNSDQTIGQDDDAPLVTPGRARAEAIKRLQIGLTGLATMILLVGLANVIMDRAKESEQASVPDIETSGAAEASAAPNKDPLADAGVVPELPSEQNATPGPDAAPQGNGKKPSP